MEDKFIEGGNQMRYNTFNLYNMGELIVSLKDYAIPHCTVIINTEHEFEKFIHILDGFEILYKSKYKRKNICNKFGEILAVFIQVDNVILKIRTE